MVLGPVYLAVETLVMLSGAAALAAAYVAQGERIRNWCVRLGLLGLAAWLPVYFWHWGLPSSAQRTARDFVRAARRSDCQAVFSYFSATARRTIEAQAKSWNVPPEPRYCGPGNIFHRYEPSSVRTQQAGDAVVVVGVKKREEGGYLLPGFWPTSFTYANRQLTLVKEAGEWRIATVPTRPCDVGRGQDDCF